jgi:hypothetical protein
MWGAAEFSRLFLLVSSAGSSTGDAFSCVRSKIEKCFNLREDEVRKLGKLYRR